MKRNFGLATILVILSVGAAVRPALANSTINTAMAQLRAATAAFHSIPTAQAAGYQLVPGLDFCFDNPGVGGMGFHYINPSMLDTKLDPLKPEAFVYAPDRSGKLHLGAVEFIVPAALWDASNSKPPTLFGQTLDLDQSLGVYELHAWIWKPNSLGMFNEWNPKVSCNN